MGPLPRRLKERQEELGLSVRVLQMKTGIPKSSLWRLGMGRKVHLPQEDWQRLSDALSADFAQFAFLQSDLKPRRRNRLGMKAVLERELAHISQQLKQCKQLESNLQKRESAIQEILVLYSKYK